MFVVFKNSLPVAAYATQAEADEHYDRYGGQIAYYPHAKEKDIIIHANPSYY